MSAHPSNLAISQTVRAHLVPRVTSLASSRGPPLLQSTNPIVTTALSKAFPVIVLIDGGLAILTWTNEDKYFNLLVLCGYITVVRYWSWISVVLFPTLMCFLFCCIVWSSKMVYNDINSEDSSPPTLEEICDTLTNMTTRMELFLQPLWVIKQMKKADRLKILISAILLTPIYIATMKLVFTCRLFVMVWGCLFLTYNSEMFKGLRNLLWRSIYCRRLFTLITGIQVNTRDNVNSSINQTSLLSDFQILSIRNHPIGVGKIIEFFIYENERRWFGLGWSKYLLPYERAAYTNDKLEKCCDGLDDFEFPEIHDENDKKPSVLKWKWLDESWKIDYTYCKDKMENDGWIFYNNNWEEPELEDSFAKNTRTRKWKRRSVVMVVE